MGIALHGTAQVWLAASPNLAIDPVEGGSIGLWARTLGNGDEQGALKWYGESYIRLLMRGDTINPQAYWSLRPAGVTTRTVIAYSGDRFGWHYYALSVRNVEDTTVLTAKISCNSEATTNVTPAWTTPVYSTTAGFRFGYDSGFTESALEIAEFSVFDFAIDDVAFNELAKGMDPLKLGCGPKCHMFGDGPSRNRGNLLVTNSGAIETPQPDSLHR